MRIKKPMKFFMGALFLILLSLGFFSHNLFEKNLESVNNEIDIESMMKYVAVLGVNKTLSSLSNYFYVSNINDAGPTIQSFLDYLGEKEGIGYIENFNGEYVVQEKDLPLIIDSPNLHLKTKGAIIKAAPYSLKSSPWPNFTVLWIRASNVTIDGLEIDPNGARQSLNTSDDPDSKASGILITASTDDLWTKTINNAPTLQNITIKKCRITNAVTTAISFIKVNSAMAEDNIILDIHSTRSTGNTRKGINYIWCDDFKAINNLIDLDTSHRIWYESSNGIFTFIANNLNGVNTACQNGIIQNNTIIGSQDSSIEIHGGTQEAGINNVAKNIIIKDNFVWGRNIIISRGAMNIQVINNTIKYEGGNHAAGTLSVSGLDSYSGTVLQNISFVRNHVFMESGTLRDAIIIETMGQRVRDIVVEGNLIQYIGLYDEAKTGRGVNINGGNVAFPNHLSDIIIRGNMFEGVTSEGIYISETVNQCYIDIFNNQFKDIGYPWKNAYGLKADSPCSLYIINNTIQDLVGLKKIGVMLSHGVKASILNNTFNQLDTGILLISGYDSILIKDNEFIKVDLILADPDNRVSLD